MSNTQWWLVVVTEPHFARVYHKSTKPEDALKAAKHHVPPMVTWHGSDPEVVTLEVVELLDGISGHSSTIIVR